MTLLAKLSCFGSGMLKRARQIQTTSRVRAEELPTFAFQYNATQFKSQSKSAHEIIAPLTI